MFLPEIFLPLVFFCPAKKGDACRKQFFTLDLAKKEWRQLPDAPIMDGLAAPIAEHGVNLFFSPRPAKVYLYKHTGESKR